MTPVCIFRDHIRSGIFSFKVPNSNLDTGDLTRLKPMPAIEHHLFEYHDRFLLAVFLDVLGKIEQYLFGYVTPKFGERMTPVSATYMPSAHRCFNCNMSMR